MIGSTGTVLRYGAACVLAVGTLAWVFPREAAALTGPWTLSALSIIGLLLALGLAGDWRVLRVLLAMLAVTLLLGWNPASTTSTSHVAGTCLGILVMVLMGQAVRTDQHLRLAIFAFLAGGLVMLVVGLMGAPVRAGSVAEMILPISAAPSQLGLAGLGDGIVNPNALAAAVLLVMPLGLAVLLQGLREPRNWLVLLPLSVVVVAIGAMTLVICNSRTAWVAIWLTVVGFLVRPGGAPWWRGAAGAVVVAPVLQLLYIAATLDQEAFLGAAGEFWRSAQDRAYLLSEGLEHFRQSPWLGIGVNEFRVVFRPNPSPAAHTHNMVLQTALDVGLVGSVAYWGVVAFLLYRAREVARTASAWPGLNRIAAIGSALSLILVSLFGLTDAVSLGARIGLFQWMAGGLILAAGRPRPV